MSDEITTQLYIAITNGELEEYFGHINKVKFDQNNQGAHKPVLSIGSTEELVSFGDIVTPGFLGIKNLDDTRWVDYGPSVTGGGLTMVDPPFARIQPGETAWVRLHPSGDLMMVSESGEVMVQMLLLED